MSVQSDTTGNSWTDETQTGLFAVTICHIASRHSSTELCPEIKPYIVYSVTLNNIRGHEWDEVTGECRKLHNGELNDLYCSPNIVWVIK